MKLMTTTKLVKEILEEYSPARNSDCYLYLKVIMAVGEKKGISIDKMPVETFFLNRHAMDIPGFETVRRTRQKIQAMHPELAASERVAAVRAEREQEFREYARSSEGMWTS